jgi:diguanylate cyclase
MKYDHSVERSTECLRKALPMMSKQAAGLHPVAYAVWYEYVAGVNEELRSAVDRLIAEKGSLDENATYDVFKHHVAEVDPETARRVADGFQRVLTGMAESAKQAGDQTAEFGSSLTRLSTELTQSAQDLPPTLTSVLEHTELMQTSMRELQSRLQESQQEISQLRDEVKRARHESLIDSLTGLHNRRAFDQALADCLAKASHAGTRRPCLLLSDIDHFKRINDTYGHGFGDQVIRAVAQVLRQAADEVGTAARIGGEEFAILLPSCTIESAHGLAEKIRQSIGASRIRRGAKDDTQSAERVTISMGVSPWRPGESGTSLLERADQALYAAKKGGRDRVAMMM